MEWFIHKILVQKYLYTETPRAHVSQNFRSERVVYVRRTVNLSPYGTWTLCKFAACVPYIHRGLKMADLPQPFMHSKRPRVSYALVSLMPAPYSLLS